jgi:hypothetical protein
MVMKKTGILLILFVIIFSSCAALKENRAAHNQPFLPHREGKMKQKRHH